MGRPLPCARSPDAARGPECTRVRPTECSETFARRSGARPTFVRRVVHGLARRDGHPVWTFSGGRGADVARFDGVAAIRTTRFRRDATCPIARLALEARWLRPTHRRGGRI